MGYTIQFKRGTSAQWTSQNPVLADGEPALETDTGKIKIGDGTTEWWDLSYLAGDGGGGTSAIVINNLVSTSTTDALSANQGRILNEVKAKKSTEISKTLLTDSWTGAEAPYSYSLTVAGVTTTSNQEILPSVSVTKEQLEALQNGNIQDGGQDIDEVILKAWGEKPTIDIPVRVILRGDT